MSEPATTESTTEPTKPPTPPVTPPAGSVTQRVNTRGSIIEEAAPGEALFDPFAEPLPEIVEPTPEPEVTTQPTLTPDPDPAPVPESDLTQELERTVQPTTTTTRTATTTPTTPAPVETVEPEPEEEESRYGAYADEDGNIDYSQLDSMQAVQDMALGLGSNTFDEAGIEQGQNVVRDMDFRQLMGQLPEEAQDDVVNARPMRVLEVRDMLAASAVNGIFLPYDYWTENPDSYNRETGELTQESLTQAMVDELVSGGGWPGYFRRMLPPDRTRYWTSPQEAVDQFDAARAAIDESQRLRDVNRLLGDGSPLEYEAELRGLSTADNAPPSDGFMWGSRAVNDPAPGDFVAEPWSVATQHGGGGWRSARGSQLTRQTQNPGTMLIPTLSGEFVQRTSPSIDRSPNPIIYDQDQRELLENEEMMLWEAQHGYYHQHAYYQDPTTLTRDELAALSREAASGNAVIHMRHNLESRNVDLVTQFYNLSVTQRANLMFHQGVFRGRRLAPLGEVSNNTDPNAGYWTIPARRAALESIRLEEIESSAHRRENLQRAIRGMYRAARVLHEFPYERINARLPDDMQSSDLGIDTPEGGRVGAYGQMRQGVPEDARREYDRMIYGQLTADDLDALTAGLPEHRQRYASRRQPPDWMMIIEDAPERAEGGATYERLREIIESQLVLRAGTRGGGMQPLHMAFYTEREQAAARAELRRLNSQRVTLNQATLAAYRSGDPEASAMGDALAVLDAQISRQRVESNPQQLIDSTVASVQNAPDGSAGAVIRAMAGQAPDPTTEDPGDTLPAPRLNYPAHIARETNATRRAELEIEHLSGLLATNLTRTMAVQLQIRENLAIVNDTTEKVEATHTGLTRGLALSADDRPAGNLPANVQTGNVYDIGALGITEESSPNLLRVITENGGLSHNDPYNDPIVQARDRLQREFNLIRDRNPQVDAEDYTAMVDYYLACIRENESVYLDPTIAYRILEDTPVEARVERVGSYSLTDRETVRVSDTTRYRYIPVTRRADESDSEYRGRVFEAQNSGEVFVAAYHFENWGGMFGGAFNDLEPYDRDILIAAAEAYDEAIARRQPYWQAANTDVRAHGDRASGPRRALYGNRRGRIRGGDLTRYDASSLYGQLAVLNFAYARLLTGTGDLPPTD